MFEESGILSTQAAGAYEINDFDLECTQHIAPLSNESSQGDMEPPVEDFAPNLCISQSQTTSLEPHNTLFRFSETIQDEQGDVLAVLKEDEGSIIGYEPNLCISQSQNLSDAVPDGADAFNVMSSDIHCLENVKTVPLTADTVPDQVIEPCWDGVARSGIVDIIRAELAAAVQSGEKEKSVAIDLVQDCQSNEATLDSHSEGWLEIKRTECVEHSHLSNLDSEGLQLEIADESKIVIAEPTECCYTLNPVPAPDPEDDFSQFERGISAGISQAQAMEVMKQKLAEKEKEVAELQQQLAVFANDNRCQVVRQLSQGASDAVSGLVQLASVNTSVEAQTQAHPPPVVPKRLYKTSATRFVGWEDDVDEEFTPKYNVDSSKRMKRRFKNSGSYLQSAHKDILPTNDHRLDLSSDEEDIVDTPVDVFPEESRISSANKGRRLIKRSPGKKPEQRTDEADIQTGGVDDSDVPMSLNSTFKTLKFPVVWSLLEQVGWFWQKGRKLVNFFYIRPNHTSCAPSIKNTHYFESEDAVLDFVSSVVNVRISSAKATFVSSPDVLPLTTSKMQSINMSTKDLLPVPNASPQLSSSSPSHPVAKNSVELSDMPRWIVYVMDVPWSDIWDELSREGWTWNYGSGLVLHWFIMPGFDVISARPGIEKFYSEDEVRKYIRRTRWPGYDSSMESSESSLEHSKRKRTKRKSNRVIDVLQPGDCEITEEVRSKKIAEHVNWQTQTSPPRDLPCGPTAPPATSTSPKDLSGRRSSTTNGIFQSLVFLITGVVDDPKRNIQQDILKHGGVVLETIPTDMHPSEFSNLVLLSHPVAFRRQNYLLALALGVKTIHLTWVLDSVALGKLQNPLPYTLPSGGSVLHPYFIFPIQPRQTEKKLLEGLRFVNLAQNSWNRILSILGAIVSERSEWVETTLRKTTSGGRKSSVDFVLIDPHIYCESFKNLDSKQCVEEYSLMKILKEGMVLNSFPRVVSVDWVSHCLQTGEYVDPEINSAFMLPPHPVTKPTVYKAPSELGGERYSICDVVIFKAEIWHECQIGKIISFSRRGVNSPIQVRVMPFLREGKQLTPVHADSAGVDVVEALVDSNLIERKVAVLSRQSFSRLVFAADDANIFVMSAEWEHSYVQSCRIREKASDEVFVETSQDY